MLDGMSDSIQGSRIKNLQSREIDRQSPTGLIFGCHFSENYDKPGVLNKVNFAIVSIL